MSKSLYLAVGYDRHVDDWYHAFSSESKAVKWCKDWEAKYSEYQFLVYNTPGWVYHSVAGDDLPRFHVEKIDVD